jgi:putative ABC transport system permease protein
MVVLLIVGQLAVLGPARRAASVPPAVATRTI